MKKTAMQMAIDHYKKLSEQGSNQAYVVAKFLEENFLAMEKEQMINFAEFVARYPDKNININGEMLHAKSKYDGAERTIDLLKEYYESKTNI